MEVIWTQKVKERSDIQIIDAEIKRLHKIIFEIIEKTLSKLRVKEYYHTDNFDYRSFRSHIENVLSRVLIKNCDRLIKASKIKPSIEKTLDELEYKKKEIQKEIKQMNLEIVEKKREIENLILTDRNLLIQVLAKNKFINNDFQIPPDPIIKPTKEGIDLPDKPGIYFIYNDLLECLYVGKSVNISQRLKLGNHHILQEYHLISFIEMPAYDIDYAEIVYIACLRPSLNYGGKLLNK